MNYPLTIKFKIAALASQISVRDPNGNELFYVKQKLFKLKENIEIYRDSSKSQLLYTIKADRMIDFSAAYTLADTQGQAIGHVKRLGARSLWRASYDIELAGKPVAHVRETNPLIKLADSFFSEIPIAGLFSGYFFHPKYSVEKPEDQQIMATLTKRPAFFESSFVLEAEQMASLEENTQYHLAILLMTVTLLERVRG